MARYIDADKTKDVFHHKTGGCMFDSFLDDIPTADVAEVKHGYLKEYISCGGYHYDCSVCDYGFVTKERVITVPNYCPNCGAKMDGRSDTDV